MATTYSFKPSMHKQNRKVSDEPQIELVARLYAALFLLALRRPELATFIRDDLELLQWILPDVAECDTSKPTSVRRLCRAVADEILSMPKLGLPADAFLTRLCDRLGMGNAEWNLLRIAYLVFAHGQFRQFASRMDVRTFTSAVRMIAQVTGCEAAEVTSALHPSAPIVSLELLQAGYLPMTDFDDLAGMLDFSLAMKSAVLDDSCDRDPVDLFLSQPIPPSLSLSDFTHQKAGVDLALDLVSQAALRGTAGVHVLLYGPPGTGKSELSRLVAASIDLSAVCVPDVDTDGAPLDTGARIARYGLSQTMAYDNRPGLILFDEAESALEGELDPALALLGKAAVRGGAKGHRNSLLESTAVPTIWVCNQIDWIDPATLRRMTYCLRVSTPPTSVIRRLAKERLGSHVSVKSRERIATAGSLIPADITRTENALAMLGEKANEVTALRVLAGRPGGPRLSKLCSPNAAVPYHLGWLNTAPSVENLVDCLRQHPSGRFGFFGPPGTGKTALTRHLAEALGVELMVRQPSDLLSKWVGSTEKNIAVAFEEAADKGAILLIDEVDSLLRSRDSVHHSWEHSHINELLLQIDNFDGCLVLCSNYLDALDPALARRLDRKVDFRPLRPGHHRDLLDALCAQLGLPTAHENGISLRGRTLSGLTLGDAAAAIRGAAFSGEATTVASLIEALEAEVRFRNRGADTIGFL